jgi:GT2 family glycosyltransferase
MRQAIVTLTRFPDIFERLRASVDQWESGVLAHKVAVTSGGAVVDAPGWRSVAGVEPFVFARNANVGMSAVAPHCDVLLINDDCELTGPLLDTCRILTDANPSIGLLAPYVVGGVGNKLQRFGARGATECRYYVSNEHLSFVCVYIPAKTRELVGDLDERFDGYGDDDRDYCRRVQEAGLELAVTPLCSVRHGFGGQVSSSSFLRVMTRAEQDASKAEMHRKFDDKYPR